MRRYRWEEELLNEIEARLSIDVQQLGHVEESLNGCSSVAGLTLRPGGAKTHVDAYFDRQSALYRLGWSLRIRETAESLRVTLKLPDENANHHNYSVRGELESPRDGSHTEVVQLVAEHLRDADVLAEVPRDLEVRVSRDGILAAFQSIGLKRVFQVSTHRTTWAIESSTAQEIAELVLDDSTYDVGGEESVREARIEIEQASPLEGFDLAKTADEVAARFGATYTTESKFERGVFHARSSSLREKMEAKVGLTRETDYEEIVRAIDDKSLLTQYNFYASGDAEVEDTYFDTKQLGLFHRGWYCRLRQEGQRTKFTFRRLTQEARHGQVLQHEHTAYVDSSDFVDQWPGIEAWLKRVPGSHRYEAAPPGDDLREHLRRMGFSPVLCISLRRSAWIVEKSSEQRQATSLRPLGLHVAKLKYDRIEYRRPESKQGVAAREFEVTGVEDDSAAPSALDRDAYHTFLASFVEACAHQVPGAEVRQETNAKYFQGVLALGVVDRKPNWLSDGRLSLRVSTFREASSSGPPPARDWNILRFYVSLTALVASLLLLSTGSDTEALSSRPVNWFSLGAQLIGFVGVIFSSLILFRKPYTPFSLRTRALTVLIAVLATVGLLLPWVGRSTLADMVALIGLVPALIAMLREGTSLTQSRSA